MMQRMERRRKGKWIEIVNDKLFMYGKRGLGKPKSRLAARDTEVRADRGSDRGVGGWYN